MADQIYHLHDEQRRGLAQRIDDVAQGAVHRWPLMLALVLGIWTGLPWLAPVFMELGWQAPARAIYLFYSLFCHQFPQRSWFLFGPDVSVTLAQVLPFTGGSADPMVLRTFIGTPDLGWKVAWSDRMVSFYGGWFLFAALYALAARRTRGLSWPAAVLLLLPMLVDGTTHALSDLWGIGAGFRDSNAWLAALTGNGLPPAFYAGDAWGSFNWLARMLTGLLAAYATIFFLLPRVDRALRSGARSHPPL